MNGILLINKEKGISSFGVIAKVRKILDIKKVGHCGTLDPQAQGLLVILLGSATKISKYLVEHNKTYTARIKFGKQTDTQDEEGKVIKTDDYKVLTKNKHQYEDCLKTFLGKSMQIPPMYSAISFNGKRLYEYARNGENVLENISPREIQIHDIKLQSIYENTNEIEILVYASKGTYIRVLCEDIAKKLGSCGYMSYLNRTSVDKFNISESITLEELEENKENEEFLNKYIIPIEKVFEDYKEINLDNKKTRLFVNGTEMKFDLENGIYKVYNANIFIGIGKLENGLLKRDVIDKNPSIV